MRKWSWDGNVSVRRILSFFKWLLFVHKARKSINALVKKQNDICTSFAGRDSSMMSILAFPLSLDSLHWIPKRIFDNTIEIDFENNRFKIMEGYDEWLRAFYGDYMELPPKEKQKRSHSFHRFFWK